MLLHGICIALSALLLFLVQPIVAKQILPWFGGGAGVWTTCLVFFQVLLPAGYGYAHWVAQRLAPRRQWLLHTALLAASLAFLPIEVSDRFKPAGGQDAAAAILTLLAATIGLPYFLLASTGPLLQSWLVRRQPARSVYRLFALSNAASLAGLIAFPLWIEPRYDSHVQALNWSFAYAVFVCTCAVVAWLSRQTDAQPIGPERPGARLAVRAFRHHEGRRRGFAKRSFAPPQPARPARRAVPPLSLAGQPEHSGPVETSSPPSARSAWVWLWLSALGVVILLGSTAHISQNVASVPFLWLAPLALYLASFVLAFGGISGRGWYRPAWGIPAALASAVLMALGLSAGSGVLDVSLAVPLYCAGVLFTCLFCHGELAARRPAANAANGLTRFYLMISLGGALGGVFAGLIAPRVFNGVYELPLALLGVCASALLAAIAPGSGGPPLRLLCALAAIGTVATAWWDVSFVRFLRSDVILMRRNFYGTLRVRQVGEGDLQVRRLLHGVILHGEQLVNGPDRMEPGSYYARSSGVGRAILAAQRRRPEIRLGVIGLGTGTLSGYGRQGDMVRFYEIDPDVVAIAHREFTYLAQTPAEVQIAIGDARLSLQRELAQGRAPRYDVLAVDAFSGDSIPVHLLTRQALQVYARCLSDSGIVAVHISNRFLDLKPVLANLAADLGLSARLVSDDPPEDAPAFRSDWVLLASREDAFHQPEFAGHAAPIAPDPRVGVWTDQFNNLLRIVKTTPVQALRELWSD
ncbi:MAG: fused MFS/spermidine synthase [Burkholderiaceae bacterium]|nr:fused MFS/spermidine synthase [Burkholderiaceae bacterium]